MVETTEATDTASKGQVGGTGSPTATAVGTTTAKDAAPGTVEFRRRWRTVYATTTQLQTAGWK